MATSNFSPGGITMYDPYEDRYRDLRDMYHQEMNKRAMQQLRAMGMAQPEEPKKPEKKHNLVLLLLETV